MNIEYILDRVKDIQPAVFGLALFPFTLIGAYYAGRASVDVSPETICAPVSKSLKTANMQIGTLEGVVVQQRTECATQCAEREQLICMEKLATQLQRIKELRCKICEGAKP